MSDKDPFEASRTAKIVELRQKLADLDAEIVVLGDKLEHDDVDTARWAELNAERDAVFAVYKPLEERADRVEAVKKQTYRELKGVPEFKRELDDIQGENVAQLQDSVARSAALRMLDRDAKYREDGLTGPQVDHMERQIRTNPRIARRLIVTEAEAYRTAFMKLTTNPAGTVFLSPEEQRAMQRYGEYYAAYEQRHDAEQRAQSTSSASGGYALPVLIDPSVILTNQENANPFFQISRVIDVDTNIWKGVSAAGVSWSFDAEAAAVSDDSITLAQPSVTVNTARGFIPYSLEVGQDWPGFAAEMGRLLAIGYDDLVFSKFTNGSGSGEPGGIVTLADASTGVEVVSTTDGAFGSEDIYKVWNQLPAKYQRNASWMMSVDINSRVRQMGTALGHAYTINLTQNGFPLFERPVYINPNMPTYTGTTGKENRLVVGDFSQYIVARRSGMQVELVPMLFDVTNNMPTGQRGWFAWARIGASTGDLGGFRLLQNQ